MVTDNQVRRLMKLVQTEKTKAQKNQQISINVVVGLMYLNILFLFFTSFQE